MRMRRGLGMSIGGGGGFKREGEWARGMEEMNRYVDLNQSGIWCCEGKDLF